MATRRPAAAELIGGKGLRQRMWDKLRALGTERTFGLKHLLLGSEIDSITTAREYLAGLLAAGYIVRVTEAITRGPDYARAEATYRLVRDAGAEAPRVRRDGTPVTQGLAQEQMWRTLRLMRTDTNWLELAAHASTPTVRVHHNAARDYMRNLHSAGYLQCVTQGRGTGRGGVQSRYCLVRDTGPRPPMVCRADAVYDPNLGRVVWTRSVNEEDAIYAR